jgi:general secretion pathway protein I
MKQRGFTLVEVMLALAILGMGLTLLVKTLASNVSAVGDAQMMGVVANLARGKMYDVEETLRKDGFQETDQSSNGDFSEDGWPGVTWEAKVEIPEVPGLQAMQQMQAGTAQDAGVPAPGTPTTMEDVTSSGLAGMLSMFGGSDLGPGFGGGAAGGASDAGDQLGAAVIQQYFDLVQQVFKASIRKVTLTARYEMTGSKREFELVAYFTDDAAMEKVLFMLNAVSDDGGDDGSGDGSGGTGSGSGGGVDTRGKFK